MTLQSHDLHTEFPEYREAIHALKVSDSHFSRLFDRYHDVNRRVVRIEVEAEVATDQALEDLKKERLKLKDELFGLLQRYSPA
ncbi:YdcH family protein [Denitromonas iodatirespirans]|uniref:YdcH family protein n=1 Tax=Denitromonas iodatirespirans TaxID=2795389 RepID=A0A944D945_DENI1|nr:YdcH family protein [Denitromonas iodatirespirans]MBT0960796.1 YdcH family protein [Denitromonas iodatirespirans]